MLRRFEFLIVIILTLFYSLSGTAALAGALPQPSIDCALEKPLMLLYREKVTATPLSYYECGRSNLNGVEQTTYALISQHWTPGYLVKPTAWEHQVTIYLPRSETPHKTALLVINNGVNTLTTSGTSGTPDYGAKQLTTLARETATIIISVSNVPNQPLLYNNETAQRFEDDSVAHSWRLFMEDPHQRPFMSLHFPMVGAVVRTMDLAETVLESRNIQIDGFIVSGISKRGWAAWLSAIADRRVCAVVPLVIDTLNLPAIIEHTVRSLGGYWPIAWYDYVREGVTRDRHTRSFNALATIADPLAYLLTPLADRLAVPKYLVNASGDDFFMPDNLKFSLKKLPGITSVRAIPNCSHYEIKKFASSVLTPFVKRWQSRAALPTLRLIHKQKDNKQGSTEQRVILQLSEFPSSLRLWHAVNPQLRDFRKSAGITYHAQTLPLPLKSNTGSCCELILPLPDVGWASSFVEAEFSDGFIATTPIIVLPDSYPTSPPSASYITKKNLIPGGDYPITGQPCSSSKNATASNAPK